MARAAKTTRSITPSAKPKPKVLAASAPTKKAATTVKPSATPERTSTGPKRTIASMPAQQVVPLVKTKGVVKAASASSPSKQIKPAFTPNPKLSKEELRARVEKLELTVATLRSKSREASRTAKQATARIADLEAEVAQLQKAAGAGVTSVTAKPRKPRAAARAKPSIDSGDAVRPGIAVQEPASLDLQAEIAKENLESHLGEGNQSA